MDQEEKRQERRLVVVTGGSSGIGLACADRFRQDDAGLRVADVQDREHPVDISDEAAVAFFAGWGPSVRSIRLAWWSTGHRCGLTDDFPRRAGLYAEYRLTGG